MIFCGSGATAGVDKLTRLLGLAGRPRPAAPGRGRWSSSARTSTTPASCPGASRRPRWSRSARTGAAGSTPTSCATGCSRTRDRPLRVGCFSAASNVTGILSDTAGITALLHRHGALAVWDYTAAAPYRPVRMRETTAGGVDAKDAVVFSPHKFAGGPQTPGVLVVRRELVRRPVPTAPGGGTIAFVDPGGALYLDDPVAREEGGTPAIVESVRAGLAVAVKEAVGTDRILDLERRWRLRVLGPLEPQPVPGDPRPPGRAPAADRLGPGPPRRPGAAPRVRRRAARRPVRHPGPGRLLLRRPVRAPAAVHHAAAVGGAAGPGRPRLPRDQAGLGPGHVPVLHVRGGRRLRGRGGRPGGRVRAPAARRLRVRPALRPLAAPRRRRPARTPSWPTCCPGRPRRRRGWARTRWPASWSGPGRCCSPGRTS